MNITLTQESYEALVALAQEGVTYDDGRIDQDKAVNLDAFLRKIEKENGITRQELWVQWQDPNSPLPPTARFPETWPPKLRYHIQLLTRPIGRQDVLDVVAQRTHNAVNILVTSDPAGLLGWSKVETYFPQP